MSEPTNQFDQPIGFPVPEWEPCEPPPHRVLSGRTCRLEPLDVSHAVDLFAAYTVQDSEILWTYLPYGPFGSLADYVAWLKGHVASTDPLFYTIVKPEDDRPVGIASYLRISPEIGSIEVGHINYALALQKTTAATEAMYLMMRHAFDEFGYRRYEWKCDALNAGSRAAALRLGFTCEGVFRQHTMYKGRNRDTAWFSITDLEWPAIKKRFEAWLAPENFDEDGRQIRSLQSFR